LLLLQRIVNEMFYSADDAFVLCKYIELTSFPHKYEVDPSKGVMSLENASFISKCTVVA
jgi:hypothetical protein